jgi:Zn finger protein HypA/HybF involved in hydrogenase expression
MKLLGKLKTAAEGRQVRIDEAGRMRCRHCSTDMTGAFSGTSARVAALCCPACGTQNLPIPRSIFAP